jgi:signal transduction histidine kinase
VNHSIESALLFCKTKRIESPDEAISVGMEWIRSLESDPQADRLPLAWFIFYVGGAFYYKQEYAKALSHYKQVLIFLEELGDSELKADVNSAMAAVAMERGDYVSAITLLESVLSICKEEGDYQKMAYILQMLSVAQFELGNFQESKDTLLMCEQLCGETIACNNLRSQVLNGIGNACVELREYTEAERYFDEALEFCETVGDRLGAANAKCEKGQLYHRIKRYSDALQLCQDAEVLFTELGFDIYVSAAVIYQGSIYADQDSLLFNPEEAKKCFLTGLDIAQKCDYKDWIIRAHQALSELYEKTARSREALHHLKVSHQIQCNVHRDASLMRVEQLQVVLDVENERKKQQIEKEKNITLNESNRKLKYLLDERREFMGLAAHDLKNPLAGIIGLVDHLKEHRCCEDYEDIPSLLELMEQSAVSALSIVTNILDDNRLEEGQVTLKRKKCSLNKICKEITNLYKERAIVKGIELICEDDGKAVKALIDEFMVRQILDNLISNAIKFSGKGNHVWVRLRNSEDGESHEIHVVDDGPGISKTDQNKLFQRFAKLANKPTANEGSSGLGLSIVKKLVEMNKGTVCCKSVVGKGSTFIVRFPVIDRE